MTPSNAKSQTQNLKSNFHNSIRWFLIRLVRGQKSKKKKIEKKFEISKKITKIDI